MKNCRDRLVIDWGVSQLLVAGAWGSSVCLPSSCYSHKLGWDTVRVGLVKSFSYPGGVSCECLKLDGLFSLSVSMSLKDTLFAIVLIHRVIHTTCKFSSLSQHDVIDRSSSIIHSGARRRDFYQT